MRDQKRILAVIPARGGSKGLPGKNIRSLAGLPLIAHSIRLAKLCPAVSRVIVSTDSEEIASVAREHGAEIPFMRPKALACDDTPMWPVIRHALATLEDGISQFEYVLLLDPTSPGRLPDDITHALQKIEQHPHADGVVGASQPEFNPIWHCVVERDGFMADLFPDGAAFSRRQDTPQIYRINASLYLWRASFVRREEENWRKHGRHLIHEIPESRAIHIDDIHEFTKAELMIKEGLISLPWLASRSS